ncbi:protein of unknown function DUF86 [Desulfonatronospira thiodismutans ASO3-1]|uniref:DUF86 domain-containing protein n=1 Tax=Desulfonatronospira thiodismutans ASO3-1 TaxID=555779 RepID=D6SRX0_9BACT|nr:MULTISPECIES: DUF86 domain-containing protein [Desulfonatronospira]EFI33436.1 protein of unknown function DUF86 [Desulfonatronospira thiodismutans ASO3-1]
MTRDGISRRVVADRVQWVETMLEKIRELPIENRDEFFADSRNALACESCLRRALEALLDLGRHILAKKFRRAVEEYKEIGPALAKEQVITESQAQLFRIMAGYRNRMVHFYHDVSDEEIRTICTDHLGDIVLVLESLKRWLRDQLHGSDSAV